MNNSVLKRVIALVLVVFLSYSQTIYGAKSINDLRNELAENKKATDELKEEIKGKEADIDEATTRMNELDVEIEGVQNDIDAVQVVIDEKEDKIDETNDEIDQCNDDIEATKDKLKSRLKIMYEYGSTSYLEILLEAKSFSDLFARIAAIQAIVQHDNGIILEYANALQVLETAKETLETEKQEQEDAKDILTERQDSLEDLRDEKSQLISSLENDINALEAAEAQKEKDAQALQDEINAALKAQEKAQQTQSASPVVYTGNGKFGWPSASSTRITSPFGYRIHPISKVRKLHRGIDIGAAAGTNVLAAESGTVLTAGYNSSYGYYITINHGGGYVTLYAHNSRLLVKSGDKVVRGQTISKCGSTGNSTGPHIHFEIQYNGSLVNPVDYL